MAVPAHDQRDFDFARKYELSITVVILPKEEKKSIPSSDQLTEAFVSKDNTIMVNSANFDGLEWPDSFDKVAMFLEENGIGERKNQLSPT